MAQQRDELEMAPDAAEAWPDRIYDLLKQHSIRQVALVPDAGHSRLIRRCEADNEMRVVSVTTRISLSASHRRISREWPASGTSATWRMLCCFRRS